MGLLESALTDGTQSFKKITRRLSFLTDEASQPVLYIRQIGTEFEYHNSIMLATTLLAEAWIGCRSSADEQTPSETQMNSLKCEVLNAMLPDDPTTRRFTLGGNVFWCRVEGHSDQYPGDVGQQSMCVLPLKITIP